MRLLLFTSATAGIARQGNTKGGYNGEGWISSLYSRLRERENLTLALAGLDSETSWIEQEDASFYLIGRKQKSLTEKILGGMQPSEMRWEHKKWDYYKEEFKRVVNDFQPDVIHVFGTEFYFGLVAQCTDVPVVIHIQGILNPSLAAYFPPGISLQSYCLQNLSPKKVWSRYQIYMEWVRDSYREREIFRSAKNFIGRTEWDEVCSRIFSPDSNYYYGGEILRPCFYDGGQRNLPQRLTVISTISFWTYKGFDMVLRTANILKRRIGIELTWKVFGNVNHRLWEDLTGIKCEEVGVKLCGITSAEQLREELLKCTCYMHPSYIDNSPNSVCEAQILGCPVVVTNVGGEASLVKDGNTGFLVPANDAYMAAWRVKTLFCDRELNAKIGCKAKEIATKRHNINEIVSRLEDVYMLLAKK